MTGDQPEAGSATPRRKVRRRAFIALGLIAIAVAAGVFFYGRTVSAPVATALADESGADTVVYRRNWLSGSEIVFDVQSVDGATSMVDITRRLLKAAEALKNRDFERVYLAHRGQEKFFLEGAYFKRIGEERAWQNPIYTIRTMPENVMNLDGTPAFPGWTGGWLGVMGKQMEDMNSFHRRWWVSSEISEISL